MENNNNLPSTISGDGRKFISLLKNYLTDISDVVNDIYTVLGIDESTVLDIDEYIKNVKITEKKVFRVQEPTLATLDRLSVLWLQMSIDETKLGDEDYFKTAKKMAAQEARKLAQVVAVAVLGEDYYDVTDKGGYLVRKPNETRLARLTSLFLHTVTPSQLLTLAILITNVSNLGDFINSIRLMSATRTSDPTQLIEQPG